jgi:hypothetical protein
MRTYCCAIGPLQIPNTAAGTTTSAVDTMPVAECGNRPIESFLEEWTSDIGWGEHAIF